jgi:hypothetical protein
LEALLGFFSYDIVYSLLRQDFQNKFENSRNELLVPQRREARSPINTFFTNKPSTIASSTVNHRFTIPFVTAEFG